MILSKQQKFDLEREVAPMKWETAVEYVIHKTGMKRDYARGFVLDAKVKYPDIAA